MRRVFLVAMLWGVCAAPAFADSMTLAWPPLGPPDVEPSCDYGAEWLKQHNFTSCRRTITTDQICQVPSDPKSPFVKCDAIPRPM